MHSSLSCLSSNAFVVPTATLLSSGLEGGRREIKFGGVLLSIGTDGVRQNPSTMLTAGMMIVPQVGWFALWMAAALQLSSTVHGLVLLMFSMLYFWVAHVSGWGAAGCDDGLPYT